MPNCTYPGHSNMAPHPAVCWVTTEDRRGRSRTLRACEAAAQFATHRGWQRSNFRIIEPDPEERE